MIAMRVDADHDLDDVIAGHRDAWLRHAEATLVALDPRGHADGGLHVFDFPELGAPAEGYLGFTAEAELHELARERLPEGAPITTAVAVNVARIASLSDEPTPAGIAEAVAAVAAHELAHVLDARASDRHLPPGTTLDTIVASLADNRARSTASLTTSHRPGWLRAYLHLVVRASGRPCYRTWLSRLAMDVGVVLPHTAGKYLEAIRPEILAHRQDARLVEILRTPAPSGFLSLFHEPAAEPR